MDPAPLHRSIVAHFGKVETVRTADCLTRFEAMALKSGDKAPAFTLQDQSGSPVKLSGFKGCRGTWTDLRLSQPSSVSSPDGTPSSTPSSDATRSST